jgi:hypothetical protein
VPIGSALVDRARIVERESTGQKVEGTTLMSPTHSAWFKCRLFLESASERKEQGERRKVVATPQVLCALRDENGELVVIEAEMRMEISSTELGTATWNVSGDPEPIRKKRSLIGWLASIERVVERPRAGVR